MYILLILFSRFNQVCEKFWASGVPRHTAFTDSERTGIRGEPVINSFLKHHIAEYNLCVRGKTNSLLIGTSLNLTYPAGRQPPERWDVASAAFLFLGPFLKGRLTPRSLGSSNLPSTIQNSPFIIRNSELRKQPFNFPILHRPVRAAKTLERKPSKPS